MRHLLKILVELLSNLFRWRANATDPAKAYQKKHDEWQKKLKELEDEEAKIKKKYYAAVAGESAADTDKLWAAWLRAAGVVGHHRAKEPKRSVCKA